MAKRKNKVTLSNIDIPDDVPDDGGVLKPGPGRESYKLAAFWKSQVEATDQANARWLTRGNKVIKRYRDERNRIDEEGQRRMNLLWANTKVMKPAIYSKCPIPIVDRKFLDRDPTGRLSSQMLERSLKNEQKNNFHAAVTMAVYDRLLPGRGIVWTRYEPEIGFGPSLPSPSEDGLEDPINKIKEEFNDDITETPEEEELETTGEEVLSEKVVFDYVDWRDFYIFPAKARTWQEVQAVGKKVHISKAEAKQRFGEEIGEDMKPDTTPMLSGNTERQTFSDTAIFQDINERSIVVMEIWNKSDLRVYWHSPGYMYLCDVKEDPLKLTGFFPVPSPLQSTTTNDTLIPVPDFVEWQDQAIQIDELTQRIAMLTKACKIAGVYNAANTAIKRLLDESVENELIPVDQWAIFADAGGFKGVIEYLPLEQIQACIKTLQEVRQQCMIDLDQVTGLSDIVRGTSDSRETLGGIRLKNNNAGTRLSEAQEDVARFSRDIIVIAAEIISKHFSDETIIESSGILFEEELQPETVMREFEDSQPIQQQPAMPQQNQLPAPQQHTPLALPAPGQTMPGAPPALGNSPVGGLGAGSVSGQSPMQPPMGTSPPQNNIIPFPGGGGQGISPMGNSPLGALATPPPDPQVLIFQKIQKAIALLRKDVSRGYRIDIETDSTIFGDKVQERADATEFITATSNFMKSFETIAVQVPEAMPLLGKMLQWGVRKYRTGRDLESEVDSFVRNMEKKAKQAAANPKPSKEEIDAQAKMAQIKAQSDAQAANDQRDAQRQAADDQRQFQLQQAEDQRNAEIAANEDARANEKAKLDLTIERQKAAMQLEEMDREAIYNKQEHEQKMEELKTKATEDAKKRAEAKRKAAQPKKKSA